MNARLSRRPAARRRVARTERDAGLTLARLSALAELACWPRGCSALNVIAPGTTLAALVQLGLARREAGDDLGDRFHLTDAGLALLKGRGVIAPLPAGPLGPNPRPLKESP